MTTVTVGSFRDMFPAQIFTSISDDEIDAALKVALRLHAIDSLATLYCAAHILAVMAEANNDLTPDGGSGVVSSEGIGPQSQQFITQAEGDNRRAFYATTSYGRMFLALEERVPRVAMGMIVA